MLTYYAYLAWLIFVLLIALLLYRVPPLGALWVAVVSLRIVQFVRLGRRTPAGMLSRTSADEEAPLPLATENATIDGRPTASSAPTAAPAVVGSSAGVPSAARAPSACAERATLGRVLLVGNGPSIRGNGQGSAIDGFDTVVRFNSFVTKGLEEHTGSRTTLWCHMMQWYHLSTVEVDAPPPPPPNPHPHTTLAPPCMRISSARPPCFQPPCSSYLHRRFRKRRAGCPRATPGTTWCSRRSSSCPTI